MTQRQPWEKPVFECPPRLETILGYPEYLGGLLAQEARLLYQKTCRNFDPWRDLSMFGQYVFFGDYGEMVNEYELTKPDLTTYETCFRWGYVSLAANGSRHFANTIPGKYPHVDIIRFLYEHGAPLDLPDIAGLTALHHVTMCNRVGDVLRLLLDLGADPNHRDKYYTIALHAAVQNCQAEAVEVSLEYGADIEALDADGVSPLQLVRLSSPGVNAVVDRYLRQKEGRTAALEQKGKCAACGKDGSRKQCARCRVVRYCGSQCQASDWKDGHKSNCRPFNDKKFTLTCKPTYGGYASGMNIDLFTRRLVGQPDGEGRRKEVIRKWECEQGLRRRIKGPPPKKETSDSLMKLSTSVPTGFIGKTITVKAIIPSAIRPPPLTERQLESLSTFGLDPSLVAKLVDEEEADDKHEVVIYDKTKRFSCKILPDGQPEEHARLEGIIREKGLMGVKAFFVAELESADSLKIKIGDMLAVQAW